ILGLNGCDNLDPVISNPDYCYASEVLLYTMGETSTGNPIEIVRTNPDNALGVPENDDTYNFVSLGYGGELVVGFNEVAINGPGDDIQVFETTFNGETCDSYSEVAEVSVSQDGINFISLGTTCTNEDGTFDISDGNPN